MSYLTVASGTFVRIPAGVFTRVDGSAIAIKEFELQDTPVTVGQWLPFLKRHADRPFARFEQTAEGYIKLTGWAADEAAQGALATDPSTVVKRVVPTVEEWQGRFRGFEEGVLQLLLGDHRPATNIDYYEAAAFADTIGARLPFRYEHEYAAKAGRDVEYGTDDGELHLPTYDKHEANAQWRAGSTSDVKSFQPNPWRLYDMCGNVWEWCQMKSNRVKALRGGCGWCYVPEFFMATCNYRREPIRRSHYFGFRTAR